MKIMNSFAPKIFAGALALALVTLAHAENIPQVVTVVKVEGHARYSVDNRTWITLKRGDVLQPGAVIQTATDSSVDVILGDVQHIGATASAGMAGSGGGAGASGPKSNVLRIYSSSTLSVDKLTVDRTGADEVSETQLDLRAGHIIGDVKKLSAESRYEVKLPNGVAGIRGTGFDLSVPGTMVATGDNNNPNIIPGVIYVLSGKVTVVFYDASGNKHSQDIDAGESYNPATPDVGPQAISPTLLSILTGQYNSIANESNPPGPVTSYTQNGIIINISPDGGIPSSGR